MYLDLASKYLGDGAFNGVVVDVCDKYIRGFLLNFERIASRNPEIQAIERLGDALPVAYRYWTAMAFSFERRRIDFNPEKFLLPEAKPSSAVIAPTAPAEIAALQVPSKIDAPAILPAPLDAEVKVDAPPSPQPSPIEEILFERLCVYTTGKMGSVAEQIKLYADIHSLEAGSVSEALREMIRSDIFGDGKFGTELAELAQLGKDCSDFSKNPESASVFGSKALFDRLHLIRNYWGLATIPDPVAAFVEDGFLTNSAAAKLAEAQKVLEVAPKAALRLAEELSKTTTVTSAIIKELSEIVNIMHFAGKDDAYIEASLTQPLTQHHISRLPHLHNCAALMSQGVKVEGLFTVSPEAEAVVARAASGEFGQLPRTHKRFGASVRETIDSQIRVIRESSPQAREMIESTLVTLGESGSRNFNDLTHCLLATTKLLGTEASSSRLLQLGQAYVTIAKAGISLKEVEWMLSKIPEGVTPAAAFYFFEDLASLQRSNVNGISNLFANCCKVWKSQVDHDLSQHVSGFFVEAQTALNLHKNGYRLISVSSKHGGGTSGVEYDLIATSPSGQLQAIEVKRSLEALVGKNDAVWNSAEIANSQLYRLLEASRKDGLALVIAVKHVGKNAWAAGTVADMFAAVKGVLGIKPDLVSADTGQRIQV